MYLQPGQPFGKRGQAQLSLPRLDLPVSLLQWELFLPERYLVKNWGGNALRQDELGVFGAITGGVEGGVVGGLIGAGTGSRPAALAETVEESRLQETRTSRDRQEAVAQSLNAPSENVYALQKRVAGVLPVRVDVPHAGESFRFARPLVLDEETTVSFKYKAR